LKKNDPGTLTVQGWELVEKEFFLKRVNILPPGRAISVEGQCSKRSQVRWGGELPLEKMSLGARKGRKKKRKNENLYQEGFPTFEGGVAGGEGRIRKKGRGGTLSGGLKRTWVCP